jgi:NAD(P)-dependent dehydrogenase (short-subunit alcohol dehydrogenase family)
MDTWKPISHAAVNALARLAARRVVNAELRGQGVRVTLVKPATINAKATEYLANHPELYEQAHDIAVRFKMYEKDKRKHPPMLEK